MKTIGLIGGMSWHSTVTYYQLLNSMVNARCGAAHSAKILLSSIDFESFRVLQETGRWDVAALEFGRLAKALEGAGADCILLGSNTAHIVAEEVRGVLEIPLLHVADCMAKHLLANKIRRVGLLGTRFTMEAPFFPEILGGHGIEVLVPEESSRARINESIFSELTKGVFLEETRREYVQIIESLGAQGAEGVILGCTEIGLLVSPDDSPIPSFDTTQVHAQAAVDFALE